MNSFIQDNLKVPHKCTLTYVFVLLLYDFNVKNQLVNFIIAIPWSSQ
jgi:hypothetical protein